MNNQQNLSAIEVALTSTPATDLQTSAAKTLYSAPQLTIHGQLERITQQTNSAGLGDGPSDSG